jgi:hypothetical protein
MKVVIWVHIRQLADVRSSRASATKKIGCFITEAANFVLWRS